MTDALRVYNIFKYTEVHLACIHRVTPLYTINLQLKLTRVYALCVHNNTIDR